MERSSNNQSEKKKIIDQFFGLHQIFFRNASIVRSFFLHKLLKQLTLIDDI